MVFNTLSMNIYNLDICFMHGEVNECKWLGYLKSIIIFWYQLVSPYYGVDNVNHQATAVCQGG